MNERDIFLEALDKGSPDEKRSFLDFACGGDPQLRSQIERLLQAHQDADSLLDHPILGDTQSGTWDIPTGRCRTAYSEGYRVDLDFLEPSDEPNSLGRIGQYQIREVIGRGGMGIVLRAYDTKLSRVVAIKVLAPELAASGIARKRFIREARAAAAVRDEHVVTIYAVEQGEPSETSLRVGRWSLPYLVMEFIDGPSLQEKLDQVGHLELKEILRIGRQISLGLAAAHDQGLIHRDIKPANILLQNGVERVQVTDFGLARAANDVGITRTGEVAGTPQYMSPEQAEGRPVDTRSDLFSLGSVLYAMCTGRSPFHADTIVASLRRVCDDTPRPIRELNPDIPEWLVAIIDRLLDKNPDGRFQTSLEVGDLLSRYLANLQNPTSEPLPDLVRPAKRVSSSHPHRRRWATAIAVLIAVFGAATISEATGVTKLTATIIRIATGEGTLVVEVDDPTVQISLDGEQLSITGAGIQELKLRPGQYKFQASKDGAQVKTELVTVVRGGRQVLRVSREPSSLHSLGETSPSMKLDAGFVSLFDGETLNGWQGDTSAYAVDSGVLIAHRRGNLFTTQEYRNFALRFDFRLGSGANNGVAIRSPLSGDPAYAGLEIQILDDSSYRYRNLPGHHRHGSIWGVVAAKPASLKFPGQWNHQEIRCVGRSVQVTLNGTVILDVDLDTVTQTADGKHHPGLTRESGYIGFMSIDPLVEFRNIRIKEIRGQ